jgi:hypothetical protein
MPLQVPAPGTPADDFTQEEIAAQKQATLDNVNTIGAQWSGLVSLKKDERLGNPGKALGSLAPALRLLCLALIPQPGEDPKLVATKKKLATIFDQALGAADHGKDDDAFEADLLLRRLDRIDAQEHIAERLEAESKRFRDDALNTGETVVEPGSRGIELARGLASNEEFHSLLAPVLNALSDMTRAARTAQANARKAAKAKAAAGSAAPTDKKNV